VTPKQAVGVRCVNSRPPPGVLRWTLCVVGTVTPRALGLRTCPGCLPAPSPRSATGCPCSAQLLSPVPGAQPLPLPWLSDLRGMAVSSLASGLSPGAPSLMAGTSAKPAAVRGLGRRRRGRHGPAAWRASGPGRLDRTNPGLLCAATATSPVLL